MTTIHGRPLSERSHSASRSIVWRVAIVAAMAAAVTTRTGAQLTLPAATAFAVTGFIQQATVDLPNDIYSGGTITVNNVKIIVPRNTILQMPAASFTWQEIFKNAPAPYTGLQTGFALQDIPKPKYTYEVTVQGNRVNGVHIAGLLFLAQQSLQAGEGFITDIDYVTGALRVGGSYGNPATGARVLINDPIGRFGRAFSPDVRFTIDEDNPTIRAVSGYPMCVPRFNPATTADPLCPQKNRPRNGSGQYLTVYQTPPPPVAANAPDPNFMAPFEVGDYVFYSGILADDAGGTYVAAHTVTGQLTILTAPNTQPAYVAIDVLIMGVSTKVGAPAGTEGVVRTRAEGFTTDIGGSTSVNILALDVDPCSGAESERFWGNEVVDRLAQLGRWRFVPAAKSEIFLPAVREVRARVTSQAGPVLTGNGLLAGEYTAPIFEFIFPEAAPAGGVPPPPNNFQDFLFLTQGEGPYNGGTIPGGLSPFPLSIPVDNSPCAAPAPPPPPPPTGVPPVAHDDVIQRSGQSVTFTAATLLANDAGAAPLGVLAVAPTSVAGGTITGVGQWTYTAPAGFSGTDSFVYEIGDPSGQTALGVVSVMVTAISNRSPIATPDSATTPMSTPVTIAVRANDSDPDGDPLTVTAVSLLVGGTATINAGATVTYTPTLGFAGAGSFTYTISDGLGGTASASVAVTVPGVANRPPVAVNDTATTTAGLPVTIAVLANDSDLDGDPLTVTALAAVAGGTATLNAGGTVTYTPAAGFTGGSFTYTINDGHGGAASATVTVTPAPNQPPVAVNDSATTTAGVPVTISVRVNDSDPDGDPLTISGVSLLVGGSATINAGTTVTYTPTAGFSGAGSFTYTISDGRGGTASAAVAVTVSAAVAGPAVQVSVSSDGAGTRTTPAFSTVSPGEVLVALAASDGPAAVNGQTLTISGAGLTWTRVSRAATRFGVAEIWTATAAAVLTNVTVTSTQTLAGFDQSLTVVAFTGASSVGASNIGGATTGAATLSLVTQAAGSVVYAVGNDWDNATARTIPAGQTKVHEFVDTAKGDTFWVQAANAATTAAGQTVTLNATAPATDQWNFAIVEVKR